MIGLAIKTYCETIFFYTVGEITRFLGPFLIEKKNTDLSTIFWGDAFICSANLFLGENPESIFDDSELLLQELIIARQLMLKKPSTEEAMVKELG
jgi:hypothetical protein